ncbi:lysophosphatidic acid phosphatase type 6 [Bufo bufo]|uniref:lysophosphatidic acid phosphatase type 6 n=1 Tax=Bufo bufo TaxID=8384 RepID=UPI001ABE693B|nr:lysophosphatidic acid phosphatase type 6 [Bufo bufo]XP_040278956.1 lysophosphatidic acid phosphatase type 6 [Bufo bufo]XP_040278957.1 lysophosphatidic acid phosphatase type 6 [Bufo bufo]XP_040278958.1 lysophosphatidic acid phosphatase type 6 [Bufo bufo]XP_040278959.1 lysophosphatidic acid phosphatase type 6 [Bufo bufo]XP_040278960.1 lysophosphatidic acid phosphatase type 6 [Bufo bufo]
MSVWVRAGLVGSIISCLHKKRTALAEVKRDTGRPGTEDRDYELKLVQVVFRHGARTPLKPIPHKEQVEWTPTLLEAPEHTQFNYRVTDLEGGPQPPSPFEERYRSSKLKGGAFPGQLTTIGMQQMFSLGARLRRLYMEERRFLSPVFNPSEVYVRSTNIVRNVESTRCLLAGLFQHKQDGPVTIVTTEADDEILYPNYQGCKELKVLTSGRMPLASSQPGMTDVLKKLHQDLNIDNTKQVDFFLLLDNLLAEQVHGFPFSIQYESHLQQSEQRVIDIVSYIMGPNREVLKLCVGPFLHTLQGNMLETTRRSAKDTQPRKLFLYATHDVTLIPLLMAFGVFDQKWPPYAADITLELYQHRPSKEWFTRLSYNGKEQVVRGCSSGLCPLDQFLNALSEFVLSPEDYRTLCCRTEEEPADKAKD